MAVFSDNGALRNHWYAVASEPELDQGPLGRTLLNKPVVIYRDAAGRVIAAPDRCPHREAPLSAGHVADGVLRCTYHGWNFGADGRCVRIPSADPGFAIPDAAHLSCIDTRVRYGLVWVCLGDGDACDLPPVAQEDDASFRRINNPVEVWRTSATRMTDNFLDISHFPWVHRGTFGSDQQTRVADISLEELDGGYHGYAYNIVANNPDAANLASGQGEGAVSRAMTTGYHLPFTVRSTIAYTSGLNHIILLLTTPIDDLTSYFTFVVWRNDDFTVSAEKVIAFDRMIGAEDKAMLEKVPGVLPLTPRGVVSTRSDKASSAWRRRFAQLLAGADTA